MGAMFAVATAAGSSEWWVQEWMKLNDLSEDLIQKEPSTVWAVSISFADSLEYIRPKIDRFLPAGTIKKNWNSTKRAVATLPNKGRIVCMSYEMGARKFQGGAVKLVWIDEEGSDPEVFEECLLRCVDQNGKVLITATPINGLSWTYEKFVEIDLDGFTKYSGSGLDNPFVSSVKLRKSVQHMSESMQRTRLFGEFTSQQGLVYDEFDPQLHVINPFEIPDDGIVYQAIDFGVRNPFCCLWFYHDISGRFGADDCLYVFREYYKTNMTTIENGREIIRLSKNDPAPKFVVADSASRDARLILARELNLPTKPSPKELGMVSMINMVKDRLMVHVDGKPRIYFFRNCGNLIKEMKKYRWSNTKAKDQPIKADDHALDALRYALGYLSRYNRINS